MGNIEGLDRAVAQLEKQAYDQSEGNNVRSALRNFSKLGHEICRRKWGSWAQYMGPQMDPKLV